MVIQPTTDLEVGSSIPGQLTLAVSAATVVGGLGFESPIQKICYRLLCRSTAARSAEAVLSTV